MHTGFDTVIFAGVTAGVKCILTPVALILRIVYIPCQILVLPLMAILLLFSIAWMVCLGIIMACGTLARSASLLRPLLFVVALPFVIIGAVLITIAPTPSPASIIDLQAKLHVLLSYPDFK